MRELTIGRLNGRFTVSWVEAGKRRRFRLEARTSAEAEAEARDVVMREMATAAPLTVQQIWEAYRADTAGRRISEHMGFSGRAVLPHFGQFRPDQISIEDSRDYLAARRAAGKADGTIHTELSHLRICLSWAVKMQMIERAPRIERPQAPTPRERYLTRPEVEALIAADAAPHIRLAILLMLTTAARVAAVLDLTWDRVDMERRQINLRSVATGPRKGRAILPANNTFIAALTAAREAALSNYVVEYAGRKVGSIKKGFASAVAAAGLSDVTPHVLRHTAAVHMVEGGISIEEVAQYLGHSNPSVTFSTYGRFSPEHLRKAADVLDFGALRMVR